MGAHAGTTREPGALSQGRRGAGHRGRFLTPAPQPLPLPTRALCPHSRAPRPLLGQPPPSPLSHPGTRAPPSPWYLLCSAAPAAQTGTQGPARGDKSAPGGNREPPSNCSVCHRLPSAPRVVKGRGQAAAGWARWNPSSTAVGGVEGAWLGWSLYVEGGQGETMVPGVCVSQPGGASAVPVGGVMQWQGQGRAEES